MIQQGGHSQHPRGGPTAPQSRIMMQHIPPEGVPHSPRGGAHSTSREGPQHPGRGGPTAPQRGGPQHLKRVPTAPQGRAHRTLWGCLQRPRGVPQQPRGGPHSTPGGGLLAPHIRALRGLTLRDTTPCKHPHSGEFQSPDPPAMSQCPDALMPPLDHCHMTPIQP